MDATRVCAVHYSAHADCGTVRYRSQWAGSGCAGPVNLWVEFTHRLYSRVPHAAWPVYAIMNLE